MVENINNVFEAINKEDISEEEKLKLKTNVLY